MSTPVQQDQDQDYDIMAADIVDETIIMCGGDVDLAAKILRRYDTWASAVEPRTLLAPWWLYASAMSIQADTLHDGIRQARSAVEDCFMSLDAEDYTDDDRADICRHLDEAVACLGEALKLAHPETP